MKKLKCLTIPLLLLCGINTIIGQKKTKAPIKRGNRNIARSKFQPIIETENWQELNLNNLSLKLIFPKEPTISENKYLEFNRLNVKSTIIQTVINSDYYLVEVREYPKDSLPERNDLGESYGAWLKTFILSGVQIKSEKIVTFESYKMVEFVYQQSPNEVTIHRAMVVGENLYQLIVQYEIKKTDTLEQTIEKNRMKIDKFFLFFELTGDKFSS